MDHYIDITVLPDPEFKATVLMNALYAKCHRVLGQVAEGSVGVSFPLHKKTLGEILRLHGSQEQLKAVMSSNWLKGLRDYTSVSAVQAIPATVEYRTVARMSCKSPENKRKRSVKKGWLTPEEAKNLIKDDEDFMLELPFAQLTSLSNKNIYKIFIRHGNLTTTPVAGLYNAYGLSKTATVPWF